MPKPKPSLKRRSLKRDSQWVLKRRDSMMDSVTHVYVGDIDGKHQFDLLCCRIGGEWRTMGSGSLTPEQLSLIKAASARRLVPKAVAKECVQRMDLIDKLCAAHPNLDLP